ncbi:MAG: class I tRNA ligase family protein, partial [Pseudomonadota bacterium]
DVPVEEFRRECRAYADKWIGVQSEEFQRLGVLGDWKRPYTTMAYEAEAAIVEEFLKFVMTGQVYRGSKPVMWSPVEQTALAEAEVEYDDHDSTQIWVKFPVTEAQDQSLLSAHVLIWTTTPWTIPANRAISFSPKIGYGCYEVTEAPDDNWVKPGETLIIADGLAEQIFSAARVEAWERRGDVQPDGLRCRHPLAADNSGYDFPEGVPLLAGDHVTDDAGTGFVHTAPGHGADDYAVWIANGFRDVPETVGPDGAYYDHVPLFAGEKIFYTEGKKTGKDASANKRVLEELTKAGMLAARAKLTHSYPHSWRSKAPVIFRNTPQWFIRMDEPADGENETLREKALKAIDATAFYPEVGRNRIRAMVEGRPDWLISRQRAWGVPLTLLVHKETGEPLKDEGVNERILSAVRERGADAWFETPTAEFLGSDYNADDYEKVEDILDVWFDSGSTHAFVLEERDDLQTPADLYLEGSDQHRGWFQSSLLESCGTRGRAPYNGVLTHGFLLDEEGRKMSKSMGNSVEPQEVSKQYGAEILRLWVASSDYSDDMRVGPEIIKSNVDAYRKLRNTVRYLQRVEHVALQLRHLGGIDPLRLLKP